MIGVLGLSTIDRDTTAWGLAPHLVLLGFGMGLAFPNMTIAVQNAVEMSDLGVATSTSNFFRNMGSTFGAAIMGALLNAKLDRALQARVPASRLAQVGGAEGLIRSPRVVRELPADLHEAVIEAVTTSVTAVLAWVAPILFGIFVLALFVRERPLRTTSALGGSGARPTGNTDQYAGREEAATIPDGV